VKSDIPSIAHRILQGNKVHQEKNLLHLPLKGVAIGNPWIDPETQYKWYTAMASNNSHGYKILSDDEIAEMEEGTSTCIEGIHECNQGNTAENLLMCQVAYTYCEQLYMDPLEDRNISYYDITKPVSARWCLNFNTLLTAHSHLSI
jgi:cathepsin A (carboxypeptidase C)